MQPHDDQVICVQSTWNGWQTAMIRLGDVEDLHWWQPPGAPRPLAHGYIHSADILSGHITDLRESASSRHLVCILKRHTASAVYAEIVRRSDQRTRGLPAAVRGRLLSPGEVTL